MTVMLENVEKGLTDDGEFSRSLVLTQTGKALAERHNVYNSLPSDLLYKMQDSDSTFIQSEITTQVIENRKAPRPDSSYRTLSRWIGQVLSIVDNVVTAKIVNMFEKNEDAEVIEFDKEEFWEGESTLVEKGSVFYYYVGYMESKKGRERRSIFRLRRVLPLTDKEKNSEQARKIYEFFE